jgi:hypothetical protein
MRHRLRHATGRSAAALGIRRTDDDSMEVRPSSHSIGKNLEDQVETLLRAWSVPYHRGHTIITSFNSRFTIDFWLPSTPERPPVVIEAKNFGVAAVSTANSRGRKAQEALYLLAHVRRHCAQTHDARIVLVSGAERFSAEQASFLKAELGPDFHVLPIGEPGRLRALLLPSDGSATQPGLPTTRDA